MTPSTKAIRPRVLLIGAEWFTERPGGLNRYLADLLAALGRNDVPATAVVLGPARDAPTSVVSASSTSRSLLRRLLAVRRAAARAGRGGIANIGAILALDARERVRRIEAVRLSVTQVLR